MSENLFILEGNLTREPELRYTTSGTATAKFSIAHNYGPKDKRRTLFMDVKAWEWLAEMATGLKKGDPVIVIGRYELEEWTDKATNQPRSRPVLVANSIKKTVFIERDQKSSEKPKEKEPPKSVDPWAAGADEGSSNDDIPF